MTQHPEATFADRHIGLDASAQRTHARHARLRVAGRARRRGRAATRSASTSRSTTRRPVDRDRDARTFARARGSQRGVHVAHRARLPRHDHAARDPAQRAREPGVVHRVHAVPARDLAGPSRSAAQLPDDGRGPHRDGSRQRVAARRRHRGGRSDGDAAPPQPEGRDAVLRRRRLPSADHRGRAQPVPSRSASRSWSETRTPTSRRPASSVCCCSTRERAGASATTAQ